MYLFIEVHCIPLCTCSIVSTISKTDWIGVMVENPRPPPPPGSTTSVKSSLEVMTRLLKLSLYPTNNTYDTSKMVPRRFLEKVCVLQGRTKVKSRPNSSDPSGLVKKHFCTGLAEMSIRRTGVKIRSTFVFEIRRFLYLPKFGTLRENSAY